MNLSKLTGKVKKYNKSQNARRLFGNFISLSSLQVISYLFPLITMPYLARVIGPDGFGAIAFAAAVVAYFSTVTDWGFKYTAVREIAVNRNNRDTVSAIFTNVIIVKIALMLLCAVVLFLLIQFIPLFKRNELILWATFALIPGYIIFPDWLFQAMEEMKYITIMNIVSKTIFTCLIFCVIHQKEDYVIEPILQAGGYFISGIFGFIYAMKHFKLRLNFSQINSVLTMVKGSTNMFISQFLPTLYNNLSVILLESISGTRATGIFSAGNKFISIVDSLSQALSRTFYPFLARRMDKHGVYVKISFAISIFMGVVLFFSAPLLVKIFYTAEFSDATTIIQIMSCAPFFLIMMNSYGTNGLALIRKDNVLRNVVLICSIFGMVVSFVGIKLYGCYGVAIALSLTWGIRGLLSYIMYKKEILKIKTTC